MNKKRIFWTIVALIILATIILNFESTVGKIKSIIIKTSTDNSPGIASADSHPLLLIHGFNLLQSSGIGELDMLELQDKLTEDLDYVDKGIYNEYMSCAELRYAEQPIIIRVSFFKNLELLEIPDYSHIISNIITKILYCTGAEKVDIISHSMGGIVSRYYIKNINNDSVRKLIMLGTPNHGGVYTLGPLHDLLIEEGKSRLNIDFIQLSENHKFMQELNSCDETDSDIEYYTIAGNIDGKGDGLILKESVKLNGTISHKEVDCSHITMKHPKLCPDAYNYVKEFLK